MTTQKLLGIPLYNHSKTEILEQIIKNIRFDKKFIHIVSLNAENLVISVENLSFKKVIETAQITIPDGIGVVLAARLKGITLKERITGVDLMNDLIGVVGKMRLRVLLIGGRPNLAKTIAECQQKKYPEATFFGTLGFLDVKNQKKNEEQVILNIVRRHKPHLIFAAFGSPEQELWLARHSNKFKGIVCIGVGQGFDVLGGVVTRAPVWMQKIGLEWLYRLVTQPWRWKRQLRLIKFIFLLIASK